MKKSLSFLLMLVFGIAMVGCSEEAPSVRVVNERPTKANVQVKLQSSNTININDVAAGQTTSYQGITAGTCEATAVIQNESVSPVTGFSAENDRNYTIVVANTTPPTLKVSSEKK